MSSTSSVRLGDRLVSLGFWCTVWLANEQEMENSLIPVLSEKATPHGN